jgi:hypothetical protein
MDPILPFSKNWEEATVISSVKPSKFIRSLREPAIFSQRRFAREIAQATPYPKPQSNAAKFFEGRPLEPNAAVFAKPPPNSPNRPPTNAELAEIRAEAEAREAAKRAELERQVKLQKRRMNLMGMQRGLRQTPVGPVIPIGKIRPQSPGNNKKDGGKRKTLRKHKGKKVKKTNKRRH